MIEIMIMTNYNNIRFIEFTLSMENMMKKKVISIIVVLLLLVGGCAFYVNDYYHASIDLNDYSYETLDNGNLVFEEGNPTKGLIFYPGGKVEYTAYIPLMQELAKEGILCILVEMPFNLAVLDIDAAKGIKDNYPDIDKWYLGGHSLGGSMAASYLEDNIDDYDGLILLGSYSTANLSNSKLKVLSVYGSEDKVLNHEKYESNKDNLPVNYQEKIIEGGCHSYFGMYGKQDGDGKPSISNIKQIEETVEAINCMIK